MIVRDGARHLRSVLDALRGFHEVLLFDTGSTDQTLEIARSFPNVIVYQGSFQGFGKTHNEAASLASSDWILSIDADEVLSPGLACELAQLQPSKGCAYLIPFHNFYRGKRVYILDPDQHVRLYNKKETQFTEDQLHERVATEGLRVISLRYPIHHYSYGNISDFLIKMERYSSLFVEQNPTRRASPWVALFHSWSAFLKHYFLKRGFLGGYRGFLISMYIAHTAFYKYLKLYETQCS